MKYRYILLSHRNVIIFISSLLCFFNLSSFPHIFIYWILLFLYSDILQAILTSSFLYSHEIRYENELNLKWKGRKYVHPLDFFLPLFIISWSSWFQVEIMKEGGSRRERGEIPFVTIIWRNSRLFNDQTSWIYVSDIICSFLSLSI